MASNELFCSNYMLLKPEEATAFDLICILFSSNLNKRKFIDSPQGTKATFQRRWVIFLTVILQKFLKLISKPFAWVGSTLEHWLNLLSSNGGIIKFIFNFIGGKLITPDEASESYASVAAFSDPRLALDKKIKCGDKRYYPALSMMASKVSYENKNYIESAVKNHWEMEFLGSFDFWNDYQGKALTQAFLFLDKSEDSDVIVVAFRGTEPFNAEDWITDIDLSWYELPGVGKVHAGFMKALGLQKGSGWPKYIDKDSGRAFAYYSIRTMLRTLLKNNDKVKFIITGHSLGAALAILFPVILMFHKETLLLERLKYVYTFGQPRVGNAKFGEFVTVNLKKYSIGYYRFVYCNDIVPRVPFDNSTFMFKHFGACVYSNSFYKSKIVDEEPNKNYFSPLCLIPKVLNAYWELIRSFLIGWVLGKEYEEGSFLRLLRVVGLVFPGFSNHMPQDYVNLTRLASPNGFNHLAIQGSTSITAQ